MCAKLNDFRQNCSLYIWERYFSDIFISILCCIYWYCDIVAIAGIVQVFPWCVYDRHQRRIWVRYDSIRSETDRTRDWLSKNMTVYLSCSKQSKLTVHHCFYELRHFGYFILYSVGISFLADLNTWKKEKNTLARYQRWVSAWMNSWKSLCLRLRLSAIGKAPWVVDRLWAPMGIPQNRDSCVAIPLRAVCQWDNLPSIWHFGSVHCFLLRRQIHIHQ